MSLTEQDLDRIEDRFEKSIARYGMNDPAEAQANAAWTTGARKLWWIILTAVVGVSVAAAFVPK